MKKSSNSKAQTTCRQCGECCVNGGAALHSSDLHLLQDNLIPRTDLITIRKGEFAHNPLTNRVQATTAEIVKLAGSGREWACCYYDSVNKSCTIYENRPLACRTLKCWDPAESMALVERDLLSRFDILTGEEILLEKIGLHEESCPLPDFSEINSDLKKGQSEKWLDTLEKQVNLDISFRNQALHDSAVVAAQELFLFGRPLFQLLQSFGFGVLQAGNSLRLQYQYQGK
ncbi:MAG: YkgJ family cysteine cluster protein [Thermodesulfobacteriota bacterium]